MARISQTKGGKIVAGKVGNKYYGTGTFIPTGAKISDFGNAKQGSSLTKEKKTASGVKEEYDVQAQHTPWTKPKNTKKKEPTIMSTESGKKKFQEQTMPTIIKANEGLSNLGVEDTTTQTDTTKTDTGLDPLMQAEYDATLTPEQKASNDYIASLTKQSEAATKAYDDMSKAAGRTARAQISTLKGQLRERTRLLEQSNKAEYKQTQQAFIRSGQAEYSPTMTAGFLSAREQEGQARISELNDLYMTKVDAVNSALEEKKYSIAAEEAEAINEIEKKIQDEIQTQAKIAREENEAIKERENIVKVAEYLKKNPTTNAVDLFAQFGGTVPFDTIQEITKSMPETKPVTLGSADILVDPITGKTIARGSKVGSEGTGGGVGAVSLNPVGPPAVAGLGSTYENSSVEAQMVIDDILNKIPAQLRNTEKETALKMEQIRKQLAAGYTYQQVVDRLSGFSLQGDKADKSLGGALYDAALGTEIDIGQLASMINRGANEQAMTTVENAQLKNATGFFAGTDKARSTIKQADTVLRLLNDPSFPKDALGSFDGRTFKVTKFFGLNDTERAKVQELETALQLLAAPIRVEVAGTAATPDEMAKIAAFQSDILDQPDTIQVQVEGLRDSVVDFHNQARSQRGLPQAERDQIIDNKKRLDLYRAAGTADQVQTMSNWSNTDFLKTGAWADGGGTTTKGLSNSDFFNSL